MLILAAPGRSNSERRRTPVDWLHSVSDQGALVRGYTKWDDQPLSVKGGGGVAAARLPDDDVRAEGSGLHHARSALAGGCPKRRRPARPPAARFLPGTPLDARPDAVRGGGRSARPRGIPGHPAGRVSRSEADWRRRIALAETLGAVVFTDFKVAASFPTDHALHGPDPSIVFTSARRRRAHAPRRRHPQSRLVGPGDAVQAGLAGRRRAREGDSLLARRLSPSRLDARPSRPVAGRHRYPGGAGRVRSRCCWRMLESDTPACRNARAGARAEREQGRPQHRPQAAAERRSGCDRAVGYRRSAARRAARQGVLA